MHYIEESLGPDEELIHVGSFHWMYTVHALMTIVWGAFASVFMVVGGTFMSAQLGWLPSGVSWIQAMPYLHPAVRILAFIFFVMGLFSFANMMIVKATTEIGITTHRLIYKRGLVARSVGEMSMNRIEGVNVLQSIFGRLFGYGRLAIRGMGVGEVVLPPIEDPIEFRRAIQKAQALGREKRTVHDVDS